MMADRIAILTTAGAASQHPLKSDESALSVAADLFKDRIITGGINYAEVLDADGDVIATVRIGSAV